MSPVSRGRKGRKKGPRRPNQAGLYAVPDPSDTGARLDQLNVDHLDLDQMERDPDAYIDRILSPAADLIDSDDPLEAEMMGAAFITIGEARDPEHEETLVDELIPAFEARATREALALLLAIGAVADERSAPLARQAAGRLVEVGVPAPPWAADLEEPVTVINCRRIVDPAETGSVLLATFRRAEQEHSFMISVDHLKRDAATDIVLLLGDQLGTGMSSVRSVGRARGMKLIEEEFDPADFRRQVEQALDAREVLDFVAGRADPDRVLDDDDDELDFAANVLLVRVRMAALPDPDPDTPPFLVASRLGELLGTALRGMPGSGVGVGHVVPSQHNPPPKPLPPKQKKTAVYQLKVSLRGAKPPIWRRLEVPSGVTLGRLHRIIQVAFGWQNSHLHVFETPYGNFGVPDAELEYRAESSVWLGQVAPESGSKIRYTYDLGDNWEHDVLVEKVLGPGEAGRVDGDVRTVRCTGGRRAAPPDDCGGVWGYQELVEILGDPSHPEHMRKLDWLGLDASSDFDPNRFDAGEVTLALSRLR